MIPVFAKFYDTPDGVKSFGQLFRMAVKNVVSYDYNAKWTSGGEFSLVLPTDKIYVSTLNTGMIVEIDGDWLFVESVNYDYDTITLSGTDAKALLNLRKSVWYDDEETQGYDAVSGTTAYCIEHYLNNNIIDPDDPERAMPFTFNSGGISGINDHYLARLEDVGNIVQVLCENAGIGYSVKGDYNSGKFVFRLESGVDRSIEQSVRGRVIFTPAWGNVEKQEFHKDISQLYNAVYATGADVTQEVYRSDTIPSGLARRETAVSVNVQSVSDIQMYALDAVKDNIERNNFSVVPAVSGYGTDFTLGDKITVRNPYTGQFYSRVITEVHKSYSDNKKDIQIVVGDKNVKFLGQIVNNILSGTQKRR